MYQNKFRNQLLRSFVLHMTGTQTIYTSLVSKQQLGHKQVALLLDPDKFNDAHTIDLAIEAGIDYFFVGGSLLSEGDLEQTILLIKQKTNIPVVLFPGSISQISNNADAILLLSLISGRNADTLIGNHVLAAPMLKRSQLEILPTGYMLIDSGRPTTVSYISNTTPIPADKPDIAACTAMAGEMLGLRLLYLDGGSGAMHPVPPALIQKVKRHTEAPLLVGGGIRTPETALAAANAGADVIVIGNAVEKNKNVVKEITQTVKSISLHNILL